MGRSVVLVAVLAFVLIPAAASGSCVNLKDNDEYQSLVESGTEAYLAGTFEEAAKSFEAARDICFGDPGVTYNLARTRHKAGDCRTAIDLYKQARNQLRTNLIDSELSEEKVNDKLVQASQECAVLATKATLSIQCASEGVAVVIDDETHTCPFNGSVAPGARPIRATKRGFTTYEASVELQEGQVHHVEVPELSKEAAVLHFHCPEGVQEVLLQDGDTTRTVACGESVEAAPGSYRVAVPHQDEIQVAAGADVDLYVLDSPPWPMTPKPPWDGGSMRFAGWILAGSGIAVTGAGVSLYLWANAMRDEARDPYEGTQAEAFELEDDANVAGTFGIIGMGLGGAAVATGIVLLAIAPDDASMFVTGGTDGQSASLLVQGRF